MSDIIPHQELPSDYIIPPEYYDRFRLVFTHFHIDRKIGRIGMNGRQKAKINRSITLNSRSTQELSKTWSNVRVSRETSYHQYATLNSEEIGSQYLLN